MAPPKELTPHQVSRGLSYVHKEAPFLSKLKNKTQEREKALRKFENYEDGQDDDDYDELDGAQVVELDANGKEIHKDTGEKSDDEEKEQKEQDKEEKEGPSIDENGRILFRKTKKNKNKRDLDSIINEEAKKIGVETKKAKKKKSEKKQKTSLLSFEDE
ncbi:hypothetical protein K501DRAFT_228373 [Backusella circina FSU 941]|nr:hypothetical protein K501DRAFT_228373 [Backusella circina FSU 941]